MDEHGRGYQGRRFRGCARFRRARLGGRLSSASAGVCSRVVRYQIKGYRWRSIVDILIGLSEEALNRSLQKCRSQAFLASLSSVEDQVEEPGATCQHSHQGLLRRSRTGYSTGRHPPSCMHANKISTVVTRLLQDDTVVRYRRTLEYWAGALIQNPDGFGDFSRQGRMFFHENPDGFTKDVVQGRSGSPDVEDLLERWPDPGSGRD